MGREFGQPNAIVMGGACLTVIGAAITAPVMWWKRRPKGKLGTPRRPLDPRLPRQALVVAVVLGVIYPLLGLSMLTVPRSTASSSAGSAHSVGRLGWRKGNQGYSFLGRRS